MTQYPQPIGDSSEAFRHFCAQWAASELKINPGRVSQSTQPTPNTGELLIWHDTDDNKTYLVYNDPSVGVRKVEMT